jgi:hypothetical protein
MNGNTTKFFTIVRACLLAVLTAALPLSALAAHHGEQEGDVRVMAVQAEAVVTNVDLETGQVSLTGPGGHTLTLTATEQVVKLEDINVGDVLVATYLQALEGELREPTEEELAEPWVVLEDSVMSAPGEKPEIGDARVIRAVCTIEGLNRVLGTATIMDSRGVLHLITDVEPEKMEGVTLGQTIVMVYTEAVALSLEQVSAAE